MKRPERMTMEEATDELAWWGSSTDEERDRAFDDVLGNVAFRAVDDPIAAETLRRIRKRAESVDRPPGRHLAPRRTLICRIKALGGRG